MRVRVPVLPAAVHEILQPHDTRAYPQKSRIKLQLRSMRQKFQEAGQPASAQVSLFPFT